MSISDYIVREERGTASMLEYLIPEWRALCDEGPCDEPFCSPEWVLAFLRNFEPKAPISVITVRQNGRLRAVWPLIAKRIGIGPVAYRWWRVAANSHFPRFDIVHGIGDVDSVTSALWTYLQSSRNWDLLQFESAAEGGVAWRLTARARESGYPARFHHPDASPWIDLSRFPAQVDDVITALSSKMRSQNRRALKRLRSRGEVTFAMVGPGATSTDVATARCELFAIEASGWKGRAKTAILSDAQTEGFYTQIIDDAFANGTLAISQLRCDGDLVASKFCLLGNGTLYELKSGFDEGYRDCSPGHLIKAFQVAWAVNAGYRKLDNCGRSDAFKLAWTDHARPFATCYIGNATWQGRLVWPLIFTVGRTIRRWSQQIQAKVARAPTSE